MITAVIATRNDPMLQDTVNGIRNEGIRVVVVDDASDEPVKVDRVNLLTRNSERLGPGLSRHAGAAHVKTEWIMFCDSHMIFPMGWATKAINHLRGSLEHVVWGAVYRSNGIFSPFWHDTMLIGGADFYFWKHNNFEYSFADLHPRRIQNRVYYDVPMVLGGCYFVNKAWFDSIGGFSRMIGYGSEEPWLSWNAWLSGGAVHIMGDLQVTHIHQRGIGTGFRPFVPEWESNRMIILKRILTEAEYQVFCSWLPVHSFVKSETERIWSNMKLTAIDRVSHRDVCRSFGLQTFDEAIELMTEYNSDVERRCGTCREKRWLIAIEGLRPCPRCNPDGAVRPKIDHNQLMIIV